jgi:hypothetical protein
MRLARRACRQTTSFTHRRNAAGDGEDLRELPRLMRNTNLARLLRGRTDDIFIVPLTRARSDPTCSERPAIRDWKARCQSTAIGVIAVAVHQTRQDEKSEVTG